MPDSGNIELFCDRLHRKARSFAILHRFAWLNRIALFLAFFPTGLIKACGHPFAGPRIGEPLYSFFSALYATGLWWRFIGMSQVIAAVLLITPQCHVLGAIAFFPILINVVVITYSMEFHGTKHITSGMLLANLYLVCWDYALWKSLMPWWTGRTGNSTPEHRPALIEKVLMGLTITAGTLALDRMNWFNHWISIGAVQASQLVFEVSASAMLISFVFYSVRKEPHGSSSLLFR